MGQLKKNLYHWAPGADPVNKFQSKCYPMLVFKHSDWLSYFEQPIREQRNFTRAISLIRSRPGPNPIKILQCKFYTPLIFKHSDWLLNIFNQSECFILCVLKSTVYNLYRIEPWFRQDHGVGQSNLACCLVREVAQVRVSVRMYVPTYVCTCVCTYVCTYIRMYVCEVGMYERLPMFECVSRRSKLA